MIGPTARETREWRSSGLAFIVIVTPLASLALLAHEKRALMPVASLDSLLLSPAALVAAITTYLAFRIHPTRETGWLAVVLAILSVETLSVSVLQIAHPGLDGHHLLPRLVEMLLVAVILTAFALARHIDVPTDPFGLGLVVGTFLGLLRLVVVAAVAPIEVPTWGKIVLGTLLLGGIITMAVLFVRLPGTPRPCARRMAGAAIAVGLAELCHTVLVGHVIVDVGAILADTFAVLMLSLTGLSILRRAIADDEADHEHLCAQLRDYEVDERAHRAQMHEINATLAGIACATTLIHGERTRLPGDRRADLESMVADELARLTRMLSRPEPDLGSGMRSCEFDVDDALRPVVLAHEARGNRIEWRRGGCRAIGDPDLLAEVVNTLLDNAEKHGGPRVSLRTAYGPDGVEVSVADTGPGVAENIDLFQWGARGPSSGGQGIGLHIAHDLIHRQGGFLRLAGTADRATFIVGLPAAGARRHSSRSSRGAVVA